MDHKLITCANNRCSFLFLRRVMVSPFTFRIEMLRVRRLAANNSSSHGIMIPSIDGEKDDFRFPKKTCPFSSDFPATCHDTGGYPSPNGSPRPPPPRSRWHIDESWVAYKTCQGRVVETAGEPVEISGGVGVWLEYPAW